MSAAVFRGDLHYEHVLDRARGLMTRPAASAWPKSPGPLAREYRATRFDLLDRGLVHVVRG